MHTALPASEVETAVCQSVANDMNIGEVPFEEHYEVNDWPQDFPLIRNASKCIKCMRCVQICDKVQNLGIWDMINTGKTYQRWIYPAEYARLQNPTVQSVVNVSHIVRLVRLHERDDIQIRL